MSIQVTIASSHTANPAGFDSIKKNLPQALREYREWCHVFISDDEPKAKRLRDTRRDELEERRISVYSAILDISRLGIDSNQISHAEEANIHRHGQYLDGWDIHRDLEETLAVLPLGSLETLTAQNSLCSPNKSDFPILLAGH